MLKSIAVFVLLCRCDHGMNDNHLKALYVISLTNSLTRLLLEMNKRTMAGDVMIFSIVDHVTSKQRVKGGHE